MEPKVVLNRQPKHPSLKGFKIPPADDFLKPESRFWWTAICIFRWPPRIKSMTDYFIKMDADEMIFCYAEGGGTLLEPMYGEIAFYQNTAIM